MSQNIDKFLLNPHALITVVILGIIAATFV